MAVVLSFLKVKLSCRTMWTWVTGSIEANLGVACYSGVWLFARTWGVGAEFVSKCGTIVSTLDVRLCGNVDHVSRVLVS